MMWWHTSTSNCSGPPSRTSVARNSGAVPRSKPSASSPATILPVSGALAATVRSGTGTAGSTTACSPWPSMAKRVRSTSWRAMRADSAHSTVSAGTSAGSQTKTGSRYSRLPGFIRSWTQKRSCAKESGSRAPVGSRLIGRAAAAWLSSRACSRTVVA